jgi:hypothetical protein
MDGYLRSSKKSIYDRDGFLSEKEGFGMISPSRNRRAHDSSSPSQKKKKKNDARSKRLKGLFSLTEKDEKGPKLSKGKTKEADREKRIARDIRDQKRSINVSLKIEKDIYRLD